MYDRDRGFPVEEPTIDDIIADAPNVGAWPYRYAGDRRRMSGTERRMEESHVRIKAEVVLPADSELARQVAAALVETLARFGL